MTGKIRKYYFKLPTGNQILIEAIDNNSKEVLNKFSDAFLTTGDSEIQAGIKHRIRIESADGKSEIGYLQNSASSDSILYLEPEKLARYPLRDPGEHNKNHRKQEFMTRTEWLWRQLSILTSVVAGYLLKSGGFLVHAALSEYKGDGILLAGASGSGKTTMSRSFKPPWISHSDDLSIVIPREDFCFDAVPMPTWSSMFGKKNSIKKRRWNAIKRIPLKAVLFFEHGLGAKIERQGQGEALCLLNELARQSNELLISGLGKSTIVKLNTSSFKNIHKFVKNISAYSLKFELKSDFLKKIEKIEELDH